MTTSTEPTESFQISLQAAEAYEATFVPAFFAQWAPLLCDAAGITAGHRVLDVACGTGIVARTAADRAGPANVTGADINPAMLTVAGRVRSDITWRQGDAGALPFADGSFDAVLCQMALMFLPDRAASLAEFGRVSVAGGTIAVLVPSHLGAQPAYGPFVEMAARVAGPDARSLLGTYFACGDAVELIALFDQAGLEQVTVRPVVGEMRFPSVEALVATEVDSTPLGERISNAVRARLLDGAREVLGGFTARDSSLRAPFECLLAAGRRSMS